MSEITVKLHNLSADRPLLEYLRPYGIDARCGGRGKCGKCMVTVNGTAMLACESYIEGDAEVTVEEPLRGSCRYAAVDIGTTNVAVLLDGRTYMKEPNVQRSFGADVLTRIEACRAGHLDELSSMIRAQVERLTSGAERIFISGNTVMELIYAGIDVSSIGVPPFTPLTLNPGENMAPCVAGYVGGDTVAGLSTVDIAPPYLYVDIGTNGEIAFAEKDGITVCACAAGPAFEYGASGLKGSEVIDEIAGLLREGKIGKSGRLKGGSVLSQDDIHTVQLAKGAVRAAIETITEGRTYDTVVLAGDFGDAIVPENAFAIGLLPRKEIVQIGNASLKGAQSALRGETDLASIAERCSYVDLSSNNTFSQYFLRYTGFEC